MLDPWKRAVVRVETAGDMRFLGTAFFISPHAAVTCYHVVRDVPHQAIRLVGPWQAEKVAVQQVHVHPEAGRYEAADLAVLVVAEPNRVDHCLKLHPGWPASGDRVTLYGYSTVAGPLEPRPFVIVAYDAAGGLFSMQDLAAPGMSGGPALNEKRAVIGIGCMINDRHLTYMIPIASAREFLRKVLPAGLPPSPPLGEYGDDDGLCPDLSSATGSIHLHIEGGRNRDIARKAVRLMDPKWKRSEILTASEFIDRLHRKFSPDLVPRPQTPQEEEDFPYVTTTVLHNGPANPNEVEVADIKDLMLQVLGYLTREEREQASMAKGGLVISVERVVGSIDADGLEKWGSQPSLPDLFGAGFFFDRCGPDANTLYEIHLSLDIPRKQQDQPPVEFAMLLDACKRARIPVDGWSRFDQPDWWRYCLKVCMPEIDCQATVDLRNRLLSELDCLRGLDLSGRTLRVLVEESLGIWKAPLRKCKLDRSGLTVPELAAWEARRPSGSKIWIATGNFLGDMSMAVETAMLRNLHCGIHYSYHLRSFADLRRWLQLRETLEKKLGQPLTRQMEAFVYRIRKPEMFADRLDCFISVPPKGNPEGYKLVRETNTNRVIRAALMCEEQITETINLLKGPMDDPNVIGVWRYTEEREFKGVVVWLEFGLLELVINGKLDREELECFFDRYDAEISIHVSQCGGEVIRSNEVGYAVVLPVRGGDEKPAVVARGLTLLRAMATACDRLRPVPLRSATYRATIEYGKMRRVIRSSGSAMDGDVLGDCRIKAAELIGGQILALQRIRPCIQLRESCLGVRVMVDVDGFLSWP